MKSVKLAADTPVNQLRDNDEKSANSILNTINEKESISIDLNKLLIKNKQSTTCMKVETNIMQRAGITAGDMLIVDKSIKATNGHIVIAIIDGEMFVRRLEKTINKIRLIPETDQLSPLEVSEYSNIIIWGVVTYVIKGC